MVSARLAMRLVGHADINVVLAKLRDDQLTYPGDYRTPDDLMNEVRNRDGRPKILRVERITSEVMRRWSAQEKLIYAETGEAPDWVVVDPLIWTR